MEKSIKERIEELEKDLSDLRKETIDQERIMTDIEGVLQFKAFGLNSYTEARSVGKYEKWGLWLDKRFIWKMVTDGWGGSCLTITGLK